MNQDVTPQGRPIKDGDISVWARTLSDGSVAVALYNEGDSLLSSGVDFADLGVGWTSETVAKARDLWAHVDLGSFTGRYPATGSVEVSPHQTIMIRFFKQ